MRHSFAALSICLCIAATFAAPAPLPAADGPDAWLGKRVTVKNPAAKLTENGKPLSTRIYLGDNFEVTKVAGEDLFVGRGWIKASDVVLYDQAIDYFTAQLAHDPTARAYHERAMVYRKRDDNDRAIADENEAIKLSPMDASAHCNRGAAFCQRGDTAKGLADLNEAIRLAPNDAGAYQCRADAWMAQNDYEKALADCGEFIRCEPDAAVGFFARGYCRNCICEFTDAIVDYTEAIRLDPTMTRAFLFRGTASQSCGDLDKAIADFTQAIRLDPKNAKAFAFRSMALDYSGQYKKADADLARAAELDPKDTYTYKKMASDAAQRRSATARSAGVDEYAAKGTVLGDPADYDKPLAKIPGIAQIPANKAIAKNVAATPPIAKGGGDAGKPAAVEAKKGSDAAAK